MNDVETRKWWKERMENDYFKVFQFFFSYKRMDRFNLKNKKILELGFGYGRELSQFCKLSNEVWGLDIASAAPAIAREKLMEQGITALPWLSHYNGTTFPFALRDEKFDFIYSCFVIQHMSKTNAKKLIIESIHHLEENGRIFFEFFGHPKYIGGQNEDVFSKGKNPSNKMYNNAFTKDKIIQFLEDLPCEVDFIEGWPTGEKGVKFNNYWVCIKKEGENEN